MSEKAVIAETKIAPIAKFGHTITALLLFFAKLSHISSCSLVNLSFFLILTNASNRDNCLFDI